MRFVETPIFTAAIRLLLPDEEYRALQSALLLRPEQGAIIPGSGGLRKIRWTGRSHGKRGGIRVIYFWYVTDDAFLYALRLREGDSSGPYPGASEALARIGKGGDGMKATDFDNLVASVKQAGRIRRGLLRPSRVTTLDAADVRSIRDQLDVTQEEFALMIGVSVATLRNWEQGRRTPDGPAQALLRVAGANPKAVVAALSR